MKEIKVEIGGKTYAGRVSDTSAFGFASLLLPNYEQIAEDEKGLRAAFLEFSQANQEAMEGTDEEQAAEALFDAWGERLMIRVINNRQIRAWFTERIVEIFPDLPPDIVEFRTWEEGGRSYSQMRNNLDLKEMMGLVVSIMNTIADGIKPASMQPLAEVATPVPAVEESVQLGSLAEEIAAAQQPLPPAHGFAKAGGSRLDPETVLTLKQLSPEALAEVLAATSGGDPEA